VRRTAPGRPTVADTDAAWREQAACRPQATGVSPNEWFLSNEKKALNAKAVCATCPVQAACLDYAINTEQPWGVWGGKTSAERGTAYQRKRSA
jgi:WhiB family redox-sensing transcriptional regulator